MFGKILSRTLAFTFALVIFSAAVFAQDLDDVVISGKVTDSAGLPVVGATVTATMTETGESRSIVTDGDGFYRLIKLRPGTYKIKVANGGFGTQETPGIPTISAQNLQKDFKLAPAGVTAETTVTVTEDDSPVVDTTRTIVGSTITEKEIQEIPNDGRNPLDLVLTLGGTAEEQLSVRDLSSERGARGLTASSGALEEAGIFGLSGGAAYSNNITIDGLDNNDDRGASFRFQPSIEGISEVQVITNQFSAEYGRASGGRVNIRTSGGSNRFRGRAFYFFRDEALNANTWLNNRRGFAKPAFSNHDPGFTFGGPIVKNKLFFFTSYEYDNILEDTIADAWVPVTGGNPKFPLPAPTEPNAFVTVTSPNGSPSVNVAPYFTLIDTPAKKHILTARADWNINNAQNVTFSYQMGRSNDLRSFSGTNRIADSLIGRIRNTEAYNGTHNWVASASLVNQFRAQYSKLRPQAVQAAGEGAPAVLVTLTGPGTQVLGSTTSSNDRVEDRWQIMDTLTYIRGSHTLRFGGDFQRIDTLFFDRFDVTGTYTFSNYADFVANLPTRFAQNFNTESKLRNNYFGVFVQDDWRAKPNLTISFGVRYEQETILKDKNNFGPRIAVAWDPFKKGTGVIRAGFGIFYNRVLLRTVDDYTADSQSIRFDYNAANPGATMNVPTGVTVDPAVMRNFLKTLFTGGLTPTSMVPLNATQSFSVQQLARASSVFRNLAPDLVIPQSYQANLGFEREVRKGWVFETNVTFNKTTKLWRETNPNAPVLPAGYDNFTAYLMANPYTFTNGNGTVRTYQFYTDPARSDIGASTAPGTTTACSTTTTQTCFVNLSAASNTNTAPNTVIGGIGSNTVGSAVGIAFAAVNRFRPFFSTLGATQLETVGNHGNSRYIGAVFELRNRYRQYGYGFAGSLRFVYTLSRLMDDGVVNTSDPTRPGDFSYDWSRSLADRTHRIALSATIDTPSWMGKLRFSPIFRYGSSAPFNLSAGGIDRNLDDLSNDRPSFVGQTNLIQWREFNSVFPAGLAQQFSYAPIGSPGTLGRNAGHGPSLYQFNVSVTREFKMGERMRLRPTLEVTNPFNMNIFSFGSNFINFESLSSTNPTTLQNARDNFLAPTRTMTHRRMRLGIRFDF